MEVKKKITHKGNVIYSTLDGIRVARTCTGCKLILPASRFSIDTTQNSLQSKCNACSMRDYVDTYGLREYANGKNKRQKRYRDRLSARSKEEVDAIKEQRYPDGLKECSQCKKKQPLSEYYTFNGNPDGMHYHCKTCY